MFVPTLPSAAMEDLAQAVCTNAEYIYTGLRPGGEKMHELLLSVEEANRSVYLPHALFSGLGLNIVLPAQSTWREKSVWEGESKAAPGEISSHKAKHDLLMVADLKELLKTVPEGGV